MDPLSLGVPAVIFRSFAFSLRALFFFLFCSFFGRCYYYHGWPYIARIHFREAVVGDSFVAGGRYPFPLWRRGARSGGLLSRPPTTVSLGDRCLGFYSIKLERLRRRLFLFLGRGRKQRRFAQESAFSSAAYNVQYLTLVLLTGIFKASPTIILSQ